MKVQYVTDVVHDLELAYQAAINDGRKIARITLDSLETKDFLEEAVELIERGIVRMESNRCVSDSVFGAVTTYYFKDIEIKLTKQ